MIKDRITYPVSEKCCEGCTYCTVVEAQCSPGYKYRKCTANVGTKRACKMLFDEDLQGLEDWLTDEDELLDWDTGVDLLTLDPDDEYWDDFY